MYAILSANDIIMSAGLRKIINTIGEEILDKYCQSSTSEPIMIPPIPDSKFLEKFPEGELEGKAASYKDLQDGYKAEVKVYRCFEELKRNVIVIHQIEYTHEQYSPFVPQHNCNKKRCKKGPQVHPCHQPDKNIDGETDFVVIGPDFVAVFEVKGLTAFKYKSCCSELISKCSIKRNGIESSVQERNAVKFEGCCEDAARQRNRMVNLIKHLETDFDIHKFTIFPNISKEEVDEGYLSDTTLIFCEDIETFTSWFDTNIPSSDPDPENINSAMISVKRSLLGLWCINTDNKWNTSDCSLSKCIMDINRKLKKALVTQQAIDQDKSKYKAQEKYPNNPVMVEAPDLFKNYLDINCLTQEQLDVFNCEERFLWVEGSAGSGKTVAMLGKIIDIVLNRDTEGKVLVMAYCMDKSISPAVLRYHEVLNNISEDITCTKEYYPSSEEVGDIADRVSVAERSLVDQLSTCSSRIVILSLMNTLTAPSLCDIITCFNYVFVDDYQALIDLSIASIQRGPSYKKDFLSEGLLILLAVKNCSTNNDFLWVFCDMGQSFLGNLTPVKVCDILNTLELDLSDKLRKRFVFQKLLSVNLRNTHEISSVLSVIREHFDAVEFTGVGTLGLPKQKNGHFLRGTKPTIYLLWADDPGSCSCIEILKEELLNLRGPGSVLDDKDIAVLIDEDEGNNFVICMLMLSMVKSELERWNIDITVQYASACISVEWPAVLYMCRYTPFESKPTVITYSGNSLEKITFSNIFPFLYNALSRARVYSTVIIYNYIPNICKYTDNMLSELRERRDICRILDSIPVLREDL